MVSSKAVDKAVSESKTKSNVDTVKEEVEDKGKICCLCADHIRVWAIGECKHPGKYPLSLQWKGNKNRAGLNISEISFGFRPYGKPCL